VHVVTEGPLGWSAVAAARKLQLPVTSSFHTNFHSYSQHYGIGLFKKTIEGYLRKLHNRTQATLVPTSAMVAELQARGYNNVGLMSRGVATDQFRPDMRSEELRKSWGAGPNDVMLLHVGRMAKEKNIALVVSAFRAIRMRVPSAKMVFVGDGPLRKQIEESCPEAIFAGVRKGPDLARHYASSDVFLFPSLTETFGNVVPEALASGLAVLSFAHAAAKELITTGHNGVLVLGSEELDFIDAAVAMAADPARIALMRQAAAPSVSHLAWDAVYDAFVETLCGVLERHGRQFSPSTKPVVPAPLRASNA
jgi:glycosyltransferase involved in cell wall biosynthesis